MQSEVDPLLVDRGAIVAPAGCGKTQLIVDAIGRHCGVKPILVLTHTNAGVAALRGRLNRSSVRPTSYSLSTIDGWALRLIATFPKRAGHDPAIITSDRPNYRLIRDAALNLLQAGHVADVIGASYARLLVDEYQDCSVRQHSVVTSLSEALPTCVVGDPLQAIFGFGDDPLAKWSEQVLARFPQVGELSRPWRWINAGAEELGQWLLAVRPHLLSGKTIDLAAAPASVSWVQLTGAAGDQQALLQAGRTSLRNGKGSVLIIGESTSPESQRRFASQIPGAVTVEAVDLRDVVSFAGRLNLEAGDALEHVVRFAADVMTNVGATDLLKRIDVLVKGRARKPPTLVEEAASTLHRERTHARVADLLVAISAESGVRTHRPDVLRVCLRALQMCSTSESITFRDAAVRFREQSRLHGRSLPGRAVGSTLLLKGLEADVAVILNGDGLNTKNLYVAMTRGSQRLVVCSRSKLLAPWQ